MDEKIKDTFVEYFNGLPKEVRDAYYALRVDSFLEQHKETQPLESWQKFAVENLIILTFVGLSEPAMLATYIRADAEISRERAENIARIIENDILFPNAHILDQVFDVAADDEERPVVQDGIQKPSTAAPAGQHSDMYREPIDDVQSGHVPAVRQDTAPQPARIPSRPGATENVRPAGQTPIPAVRTMQTDSQPSNALGIFGERLTKSVSTPVEQTVLGEKKTGAEAVPMARPAEASQGKAPEPAPSAPPKGHDPYREPID